MQQLVDIAAKRAEGKGKGYEHWAKIHNLQQAARTLNVYQEYGFTSPEQLEAAVDTAYQEMRQTSGKLKTLETKLQGKKELQRQVLAYAKTKHARDGLKAQKSDVNHGFFARPQRGLDTFIFSPGNGVLNAYKRPKSTQRRNHVRQPKILLPQAERELL